MAIRPSQDPPKPTGEIEFAINDVDVEWVVASENTEDCGKAENGSY